MQNDYGMYQGYKVEDNSTETNSSNMMYNQNMNMNYGSFQGCPIYECPQERQIHKQIIHNVPHICPINTRIINHHIFRHTYSPCYTCQEENDYCNVNEGCCNNF